MLTRGGGGRHCAVAEVAPLRAAGNAEQSIPAIAVYTTSTPSGILDCLGFPIILGMGRFSGAVVVYILPVLKGT